MKRKSRGQALVEFALVFPLIMSFLFGTIEFGFLTYSWSQANYAARRGAEQASSGPPIRARTPEQYITDNDDDCVKAIRGAALRTTVGLQPGYVKISYHLSANDTTIRQDNAWPTIYRRAGFIIQVQIRYFYEPLTPVGDVFLDNVEIDATSRRTIVRYDFSSIDPLSVCR
ncbi:MAG TPA: pilus assembly protein [Herpetosiphon sp.]|uniref:TadE family protein n=1 Tax=Herpetosiphon aurantiacus (strain ATCC 23779 / DSM 785 / 114-95) TaxID=316274 RepID=A9AUZ0_HERA2|nr:TadE family protein [Herpetosiphon sp.]ABX06578.1 TadE family protein [Herpetosiphon aurantiacus DSM 785]HBW50585.1 pilus assembly protein [Herpetosiphon sp.]